MKLRLGRCRVSISFWFFVSLALAGVYGGGGILSGLIAAAIHESGHILAAYLCLGRAVPVSFDVTPFGLRMGMIPAYTGKKREIYILSGGIAANIFSAAVFWALYLLSGSRVLSRQSAAGIWMAAVNAVPVQSLDGGKLLEALAGELLGPDRTDTVMFRVSLVTVFLMAMAGMLLLIKSRSNFSLLLLSLWLAVRFIRGEYDT